MAKLNARKIETAKPGKHGDGRGLQLAVAPSGAKKWTLRYMLAGKAREMGLGPYPEVGLADAREKALDARRLVKNGVDPIEAKRRGTATVPTFGEWAAEFLAAREGGWRSEKHKAQWAMTLSRYCEPIREKPVDAIDTEAVLSVLKPLWTRAPETGSRLRGRIEAVLNAAKAKGFRSGENPARWRGHLDALLAKRGKLTRSHHAAMRYQDVGALIAKLRESRAAAALALEFIILTVARSGEAFGARWDEIDLDAKVWTTPAARMKAGRPHSVPLPDRAVEIVKTIGEARVSDFVFPGRSGQALTAESTRALLHRLGVEDATTHGFRSSFRDWAGNETHHPREVIEHALAHGEGDATEQSYRRSDALEKRRALMRDWAAYCEMRSPADNVVKFPAIGGSPQ